MKIDIEIPDAKWGDWEIKTFEISPEQAAFANMRAAFSHPLERITAGTYKKLTHRGSIVMTNTPNEIRMHSECICRAKGRVLLNGLGLGMVLKAILAKPEVQLVVVNEIAPEVIKLVAPSYQEDARVLINQANAFTWKPSRGTRFDVAWHDIWNDICSDNRKEMNQLFRKYAHCVGWQGCWFRN